MFWPNEYYPKLSLLRKFFPNFMLTTDSQKGKFLELRQIWLKMFCAWNLLIVAAIG